MSTRIKRPKKINLKGIASILEKAFRLSGDFSFTLSVEQALKVRWAEYCSARMKRAQTDDGKPWLSFDFPERFSLDGGKLKIDAAGEASARLQVCRCFAGQAWSVSVRGKPPKGFKEARLDFEARAEAQLSAEAKGWRPKASHGFSRDPNEKAHLFSFEEMCDALYDLTLKDAGGGLVLITGTTNSGKSEVSRGLLWKYLSTVCQNNKKPKRMPHVVTYEEPIEERLCPLGDFRVADAINYTPRQAGVDCESLHQAFTDALRQTPIAFYVGEVRSPEEMKECIDFGGTGHLVVATAHSGSLTEAVAKILTAVKANTPGKRAMHVPKILAVVHLREVGKSSEYFHAPTIPALYKRTIEGQQQLVADGLAGILPHFHAGPSPPREGSLGRQYFVKRFSKAFVPGGDDCKAPKCKELQIEANRIRNDRGLMDSALGEDLYGR
jgi:hypothetical protein